MFLTFDPSIPEEDEVKFSSLSNARDRVLGGMMSQTCWDVEACSRNVRKQSTTYIDVVIAATRDEAEAKSFTTITGNNGRKNDAFMGSP